MGEKYDALDDATRSQVDAALEILRGDATQVHNRTLLERLDRIEAGLKQSPADPPTPPPAPAPVPPPPPRPDPAPAPTDPPADPPRRGGWWGDRLHGSE